MKRNVDAARTRFKVFSATALAVGALACHDRASLEQITVARTTLLTMTGESSPFTRGQRPELSFEVSLQHAPQGASLDLRCDWTGPAHELQRQNHWQTKQIDKDLWPTHCRRQFESADPAGEWSVVMKLGERVLATQRFSVQ